MGIQNYVRHGIISHQTPIDPRKLKTFRKVHDPHDRAPSIAASGATYTYTYHPTGVGTIIRVKCRCGIEEDLTDYDNW